MASQNENQPTTSVQPEIAGQTGAAFEIHPTVVKEAAGTTLFTSDTLGNVATRARLDDVDPSLWSSLKQDGAQDIIDFLKKPVLLANGQFTTTDAGNFSSWAIPDVFLSNPRVANKLAGVGMIRADFVFTLNVNAVRFQQGRYMLCYCPSGGLQSTGSATYAAFYKMHCCNTTACSQLPHVEIDLATQTTAEIRIPYMSIFPYLKLTSQSTQYSSLGILFLRPYSALQAGSGDTTANWMLFGRMENVVLSGNVLPQSGKRRGNMSVTRKEQGSKHGPISSVMGTISEGTAIMAKLPLIGPTLGTVSWIAENLGNAAAAFGFSKPTQLEAATRVARYAFPGSGTTDGFTPALPLGLRSNNEVVTHSGVGRTDIDEMSIDFIKQQYAYTNTISWTTASTPGTILGTFRHNPLSYYTTLGAGAGQVPSPICFLATNFRLWRGGMKFRLKFVKTEFHSGRLVIAYSPYLGATTTPTLDTSAYLFREIVDVRDTTEVEFCVPYAIPDLYTSAYWNGAAPDVGTAGHFYIMVGDTLVAPNTVQSSIVVLVEVCGAPDFEVALPVAQDYQAVVPFATQCGQLKDVSLPSRVKFSEPQSSYLKHPCQEFGQDSSDMDAAMVAVGEKAESMRQLIKRISPLVPNSGTYPSGTAGQVFTFNPYALNPAVETTSLGGTIVYDTWKCDFFSTLSLCYAFSNGGMRLFLPTSTSINLASATVDRDFVKYSQNALAYYQTYSPVRSSPTQVFQPGREDPIHVSVPAYNRNIGRSNASQIVSSAVTPSQDSLGQNITAVTVASIDPPNATMTLRPYRYCADDYSMSMWVGTVPIIYS